MSEPIELKSGLPHGGILFPMIFTIYGADLEMWVEHSSIWNYADDISSFCKGKEVEDIVGKLEKDAKWILEFMASNGLLANPTKTV